jgi:hypothetical protein
MNNKRKISDELGGDKKRIKNDEEVSVIFIN